jgi:DNA-binding IclR family transcriptional regulator
MIPESSTNVERAVEILVLLGQSGVSGMSLQAVSEHLGDAKSATRRALVALSGRGFVESAGRRGQYRLGPAIYGLANKSSSTSELVRRFRPAVMEVAAQTGQSSYLMTRAGFDAICVDMHEGTAFVRTLTGGVGGRVPLGVGPGSTAILLGLDADTREAIIARNAPRYPQYNGTNADQVRRNLERALEQGCSYDIGEMFSEAGGVASPIPISPSDATAAISIAMPVAQLDPDRAQVIAALMKNLIAKYL